MKYRLLIERDRENWEAGKAEGLAKGKGLGIEENRKETAIRMIKSGKHSMDEIAEISGLSIAARKNLEKQGESL